MWRGLLRYAPPEWPGVMMDLAIVSEAAGSRNDISIRDDLCSYALV